MASKKTPLAQVNEEHGGKEKLVDKLLGVLERGDEDKEALKRRLLAASNRKLLRLIRVSQAVKEKYGDPEKLVAEVASALGRAKDADYVKRLSRYTPSRLLDMARSLAEKDKARVEARRAARAAKAAAPKAAAKAPKATEKKPAARKTARKK